MLNKFEKLQGIEQPHIIWGLGALIFKFYKFFKIL